MDEHSCCEVCRGISIEILEGEDGYRLHADLNETGQCAVGTWGGVCHICSAAWEAAGGPELHEATQKKRFVSISRSTTPNMSNFARDKLWIRIYRRKTAKLIGAETPSLSLFTLEDDPAVAYGVPWIRPSLPGNTAMPETFQMARWWIAGCLQGCTANGLSSGRVTVPSSRSGTIELSKVGIQDATTSGLDVFGASRPARLIDVGSMLRHELRLVDGTPSTEPYAALSYTWGVVPPYWKTTKANVQARRHGFKSADLALTLRHAVEITAGLHLQYVWADALCIVQDDEEDWAREAAHMADVYRNAQVTIAADSSLGSTAGIFNARSQAHFESAGNFSITNILADGTASTLYLMRHAPSSQWESEVARGRLSTRGWCCQESLLSPRILHYTDTQLIWECGHGWLSEDNYILEKLSRDHLKVTFGGVGMKTALRDLQGNPHAPTLSLKEVLNLWYLRVVEQSYSHRQLTRSSDNLVAIGGLARVFMSIRPMAYHAGLWAEGCTAGLIEGLGWARDGSGSKATDYRAPSWSWASQDSVIHYASTRWFWTSRSSHLAEVVSISTTAETGDECGAIAAGYLVLKAPLMHAFVSEPEHSARAGLSERELELPTGDFVKRTMDDDRVNDTAVVVCPMAMEKDPKGRGATSVWFLLLQRTDGDCAEYQRIGFVETDGDDLRAGTRRSKLIAATRDLERQTITIV